MKRLLPLVSSVFVSLWLMLVIGIPSVASNTSQGVMTGTVLVTYNASANTTVSSNITNINTANWISSGLVNGNVTNVSLQNGGVDAAFMPGYGSNTWFVFLSSITNTLGLPLNLTTGGNQSMSGKEAFIPATTGYLTINDAASLEPAGNFSITTNGYVDTTVGTNKSLVYKNGAVQTYISGAGNITSSVTTATITGQNSVIDSDAAQTLLTEYTNSRHIARASNGDLWTTYMYQDGGSIYQVWAAKSTDNGATWGSKTQLSSGIHAAMNPAIAIDSANHVYVVWEADDGVPADSTQIFYSEYTGAWSGQAVASDPTVSFQDQEVAIAVDGSDQVFIVFFGRKQVGVGDWFVYYRQLASGTQEKVDPNAPLNSDGPSLAIDYSGNPVVCWTDATTHDIYRSYRSGGTWGAREAITNIGNTKYQRYPVAAFDSSHNTWVAWYGTGYGVNSGTYQIVVRERTSGGSWQTPTVLTDHNYGDYDVSIAVDSSDNVDVVWTTGTNLLEHAQRTGGTWGTVETLASGSFYADYATLLWAEYPTVGGVKTNILTNTYYLTYWNQTTNISASEAKFLSPTTGGVTTSVTASSIATGEHVVRTTADGSNLKIYVDDMVTPKGTAAFTGTIANTANDWTIDYNNAMPYLLSYTESVGGITKTIISWQYGTTFTDGTGNGNNATPTFPTASNDPYLTAYLATFSPITQAQPPGNLITNPILIVSSNMSSNFTSTNSTTVVNFPGSGVINETADASGTPRQLPWIILSTLGILMVSVFLSWSFRRFGGPGSSFIKLLLVSCLIGIAVALHIWDFWMLALFVIPVLALAMSTPTRRGI